MHIFNDIINAINGVIINGIILLILGLSTLRWVVAKLGIFSMNKKFSYLLYDKYDSGIVSETLRRIGLTENEVRNHISLIRIPKDADMLDKIICLCFNNVIDFQKEMQYGRDSPVRSRYYINSMEASYKPNEREIMVQGILYLCVNRMSRIPDFIITPKNGNPHLSYAISEYKKDIYTIVVKSEREGSYVPNGGEVNYEGISALVTDIKDHADKKLFGVAVDCNASGCGNLKNIIKRFNEEIQNKYTDNISVIDTAVILFRPDSDNINNDDSVKIYRYFDLDEEIKKDFVELKQKAGKKIAYNDGKYKRDINDLKKKMRERNLIKGNGSWGNDF
jgi:hypothetical protein